MSEWWEEPYRGGPMAIPASYFPRPLYPPDSVPGRKPSKDGPDILAYKRTVSRLQRWDPWDPAKWDDSFSNAFSHGRGTGNVGDSGVAGFQRQMNLDPTGFVGEKTFNALASARVPEGPNEGQMAMDANACNLIGEAFTIYGGKAEVPPPAPTESVRERALEGALSWLGYHETGNNHNHFGVWYGMDYQPWCAMAVTHWFEVEGGGCPSFTRSAAYSYCPYVLHDAQGERHGLSVTNSPIPGDVVLFDWGFDGVPDHIGIFIDGSASSFESVEGNTSPDSGGSQSNGGEVCRKHRRSSDAKLTFVRVEEP